MFKHRIVTFFVVCFYGMILPMSSPAARDIEVEKKIQQAFDEGKLKGLHGMLVTLRGETFAEVYFKGKDQSWGTPTGIRQHGPDTLHDLRSVTKSIVSLLYGIALSESAVPKPDSSLIAGFPEYTDLAADIERQKITVADALTMQMGIEWNEDLPYSDPRNSEIAMEYARIVINLFWNRRSFRNQVKNGTTMVEPLR